MSTVRGTGSNWKMALAIAVAVTISAGCVTAATPSPGGSPGVSPTPSAPPAASPTASPTPIPTIGPAPTTDWKSIGWIKVDGPLAAGYPAIVPSIVDDERDGILLEGPNVHLEAVYGGYLQLLWDPYKRTLTPWLSSNAQTWRNGAPLDLAAWKADFEAWDKLAKTQISHDGCGFVVDDFATGPSGMVMRAHFECAWGCGGDYRGKQAMWSSSNGLDWKPLDMAHAFGKAGIAHIYGGGNGLIGLTPNRGSSWTSTDGRAWHKGTIPSGATDITDPASIAGSFLIGGTILVKSGPEIAPGAICEVTFPTPGGSFQAVAWTSRDGVSWERHAISPTLADNADVQLTRIDDHDVMAIVTSKTRGEDGNATAESVTLWFSHDGRSWTELLRPSEDWWPRLIPGTDRGLLTADGYAVGSDGLVRPLVQDAAPFEASFGSTGEMPPDSFMQAIGPVGVLLTDGLSFWLGIPSA